jgi:hypothetical protein
MRSDPAGLRLRRSTPEPVRSLEEGLRLAAKLGAAAKQQLDRSVASALAALQQQPTVQGLDALYAAFQADVGPVGAPAEETRV